MTKFPLLTNNKNSYYHEIKGGLRSRLFYVSFDIPGGVGRGCFLEKEKELFISTAPNVSDMIRTRDLLIRSQTLYPAELHSHT